MIEILKAAKTYGSGESATVALKDVSLKINDGDFIVLLGASGSGKSTLLHIVSGLECPDSGSVNYDGVDITALSDDKLTAFRKEKVGFIFQQYYLLPNLNVDKNVKMGADLTRNRNCREIIEAVGLGEKLYKMPFELSGGEQQRVLSQERWQKSHRCCFWMNPPVHWTKKPAGRYWIIYAACKRKSDFWLSWSHITRTLRRWLIRL